MPDVAVILGNGALPRARAAAEAVARCGFHALPKGARRAFFASGHLFYSGKAW